MMAGNGAIVAAADIDPSAAHVTAADCTQEGAAVENRRAIAIEADCGDVASIDRMIAHTVAELGRLDVIVNNAGVTRYAYIMDLTEADWDRIHRVNAKGVFFCLQRAAREMIKQHEADGSGGRIINIASISGRGYAGASNAAYAASKGAVISLTKMAAQQFGPLQHQRQCDLPRRHPHRIGRAQRRRPAPPSAASRSSRCGPKQEALIPIRRANTPDDIAAMALFLASPGARNITGQSYNVDGGLVPS